MNLRSIRTSLAVGGMALLVAGLIAGCSLFGSEGSLTVFLTDAPAQDFDEVVVNIRQIVGIQAGDEESADSDDEVVILEFDDLEAQYDLLTLQDVEEALGTATIPAGTYTQLRLIVYPTGNYAVPSGDTASTPMRVASGTESGVKIVVPGGIVVDDDENASITLDWDLQSENATQINLDSDEYVMTPVIKVVDQSPAD